MHELGYFSFYLLPIIKGFHIKCLWSDALAGVEYQLFKLIRVLGMPQGALVMEIQTMLSTLIKIDTILLRCPINCVPHVRGR